MHPGVDGADERIWWNFTFFQLGLIFLTEIRSNWESNSSPPGPYKWFKSLFNHYTETQYKVCSLPDKAKWVTENVNWGSESEQWDDFDPDKVKIWESDEIGKKFEGIITCYGIDFDLCANFDICLKSVSMLCVFLSAKTYILACWMVLVKTSGRLNDWLKFNIHT